MQQLHFALDIQSHHPQQSKTHYQQLWQSGLFCSFNKIQDHLPSGSDQEKAPNFWSLLLANADTGWAKPATEATQPSTQHLIMTGSSHMLLSSWRQPPNPGQVSSVNSLAKAVGGDFGSWLMVVPIQQRPNCGG